LSAGLIALIRSTYSLSRINAFGSEILMQYWTSSSVNRKFKGMAQAPVFMIPKNASSQWMEFLPSKATFWPFPIPLLSKVWANLFVLSSNRVQLISFRALLRGRTSTNAI
jgi:hypothetical protein